MDEPDIPEPLIERARRLTRRARHVSDETRASRLRQRRDALLDRVGYAARVRESDRSDGDDVLVLHPDEWLEDGTAVIDRIADLDRAVERPLTGEHPDEPWVAVDRANRDIVEAVRSAHGSMHAANVEALADFMGNHRCKRIEDATPADLDRFRSEYYVRNAWPSDRERAAIDESLDIVREILSDADASY